MRWWLIPRWLILWWLILWWLIRWGLLIPRRLIGRHTGTVRETIQWRGVTALEVLSVARHPFGCTVVIRHGRPP